MFGLQPYGFPSPQEVLDATFQEVRPDGTVAWSWSSAGKIGPIESLAYKSQLGAYPGFTQRVWDWQHINAIQPYQNGYLISLRHTDAIYYIDASNGSIVWKLGGTLTPQSLKIIGDPNANNDFGSQHDVRARPDGTISLFDNGTRPARPPRVLQFSIDAAAGTATLQNTIVDPAITSSICCGSARLLTTGNWVVAWGATPYVEELTPSGQVVFRLKFAWPYFTYRAVPILSGQVSESTVIAGMDAMYPRAAGH